MSAIATRAERSTGVLDSGEMDGKRYAEHIGVAHGTVKRWLSEGMPARRHHKYVWITPAEADAWIAERFKGRRSIAFQRKGVVYFIEREDGAIKIGWSSDVMRRLQEIRKEYLSACQLIACYPGNKTDELRLHATFSDCRIAEEWFRPEEHLQAFIAALGQRQP